MNMRPCLPTTAAPSGAHHHAPSSLRALARAQARSAEHGEPYCDAIARGPPKKPSTKTRDRSRRPRRGAADRRRRRAVHRAKSRCEWRAVKVLVVGFSRGCTRVAAEDQILFEVREARALASKFRGWKRA